MSESTSEDFSGDSDSDDVSQDDEKPTKTAENGKRKVTQIKKSRADETDSSDDDDEPEIDPQPVKKRKTLQDYLNEKVIKLNESKILT